MNTALMISDQQSGATLWHLGTGQSMRLAIGPGRRHLRVREGRLWLTGEGSDDAAAEDVWLGPGEDVVLPEGAQVVAEGWPKASFELIVPPQACAAATSSARRAFAWWPGRA